jgi:putative ABC transport system substrate-binding protein
MRRREFIALLGGATAAWPCAALAQQPMPTIGFLLSQSTDYYADLFRAFRQGLKETGYAEGENVAFIYRSSENQIDRLPELAVELARRPVAIIVAEAVAAALAAKAATTTIPIVFSVGDDPVRLGLIASLSRPDGNLTGVNFLNAELTAKRLELLRELVPGATRIAALVNPSGSGVESILRDLDTTARAMGLKVQLFTTGTSQQIDAAFATFANERPHAAFISPAPFLRSRRVQIALLAARYGIPTAFALREYVEAGGLMSYGASLADAYRQLGGYAGRILKGGKPADMPVVQSTKFEWVINAQTAKVLGLAIPPALLARADDVIE